MAPKTDKKPRKARVNKELVLFKTILTALDGDIIKTDALVDAIKAAGVKL